MKKGVDAQLYQVPETLPKDVLEKMHAAKFDIPVITPADLVKADGFLLGLPTRYGMAPAQVKTFWDATGGLWAKGELAGKYCGMFTSSATQHGGDASQHFLIRSGQETTILTFMPVLAHHGMLFVPFGYSSGLIGDNSEVLGGSPWGASTIANSDGSRQPSAKELAIAVAQGVQFGNVINRVQ